MDALTALHTRNSAPSLVKPAPGPAERDQIFAAALRAPDHARLRPWRFLVVEGAARKDLGRRLAEVAARANPDLGEQERTKLRNAPLRAPMVVVVAARLQENPKVPEIEQLLSAGCAAHGMLLACHALGYGAMWRTGSVTYLPGLNDALGLDASDRVIAFLYIGTVAGEPKRLPEERISDYVENWTGEAS
ncbi:MAG: nitroreductase [Gammaproteobacteria bacterium]|nr:nitroreductase [Gammaproteobacteria bacterium]